MYVCTHRPSLVLRQFVDFALFCPRKLLATRFTLGVAVGIPAALLVINRRLYKIAKRTAASLTTAEKRRDICVDLAIGLGIPILQMALGASIPDRFATFASDQCYRDHC